ncbi:hypothetical protein AB833_21030 [Chromatiales bacterium (ex Bugula neritina AB1)]|nr:hypothetical protein AB833_21030 [Chromatiales bacterium (ex Bugula neritina AB1)]
MKENYYFDNAATTWPKPEPVYQFMDSFFRSHGVNPGRSGHTLAVEAEQMIFATRRMLAEFFGHAGDPNRVVFTQNATDSINLAIRGMVQNGDHIVISQLEHNAVLRTANHLQRDSNIAVSVVEAGDTGYLNVSEIIEALKPSTRAIVINHASNVIGTVQNIEEIAAAAKQHGVHLIVDSAQTAGVVPIDMSCGIDVLTFTGHKGLFGPMGIGGMIVGESVDLAPGRFGGTGVDSASLFQPDSYPHRLEAGTVSIPGIAGLNAAQKWFAELGASLDAAAEDHQTRCNRAISHIHDREMSHIERIANHLHAFDSVTVLGSGQGPKVATMSFTVDGMIAQQVAEMLDADHYICSRAGLHCAPRAHEAFGTSANGAVRLSPGYFTEDEDVDHLLEALSEVLE